MRLFVATEKGLGDSWCLPVFVAFFGNSRVHHYPALAKPRIDA
jgi:hypothetical protein